jgi:hypothetical protein
MLCGVVSSTACRAYWLRRDASITRAAVEMAPGSRLPTASLEVIPKHWPSRESSPVVVVRISFRPGTPES